MNHPSKLSPPKNQAPHRALNAATAGRIAIIPGLNSNSSAPIKSQAPRARAAADQMLADRNILKKPYFADLTNGAMSLPGFRDTQEQFLFAVRFFSRPMAALASRLPSSYFGACPKLSSPASSLENREPAPKLPVFPPAR